MTIFDARRGNLQLLINDKFNKNVSLLADAVKKKPPIFYNILNGKKNAGEKFCRDVESILGLEPGYLDRTDADSTSTTEDEFFPIPEYENNDLKAKKIIKYHRVDRSMAESGGWNINKLIAFRVPDDAMVNKLYPGDPIAVETKKTKLINNNTYLLYKNGEYFIRKVFKHIGTEEYDAIPENKDYPIHIFNLKDTEVIGEVVLLLTRRYM